MSDTTVRPAGAYDRNALARIMPLAFEKGTEHRRVWGDREHVARCLLAQTMTDKVRHLGSSLLVAEADDVVAGGIYVHLGFNESGFGEPYTWRQIGIIDTLAVDAWARRRGVARALLTDAERRLTRSGADFFMLECPKSAAPFYEACGYTVEPYEVSAVAVFPPPARPYSFGRGRGETGMMAWKVRQQDRLITLGEFPRPDGVGGKLGRLVLGVWPGDLERAMGHQADQARALGFG